MALPLILALVTVIAGLRNLVYDLNSVDGGWARGGTGGKSRSEPGGVDSEVDVGTRGSSRTPRR